LLCLSALPARAEDTVSVAPSAPPPAIDPYHELETKYIFGFTEGADIGAEGEKAIEFETTTAHGMRGGTFNAIEQEVEFEGVPTQFFGYELSAHGLMQDINNVEGLDNLSRTNFSGLSAELRFLVFDRSPSQPIAITLIAEPEWARVDDVSGELITAFSSTFGVVADTELISNRLYAAANLTYEPGVNRAFGDPSWEQESELGITAAMSYRVAPQVTMGGEIQYYRAFDGLGMQTFVGNALYIGPTMHIQMSGHVMVAAAFSAQVAGHAIGDDRSLDLTNFQRYIGNLKVEFEF
jgi:hypothetical protein